MFGRKKHGHPDMIPCFKCRALVFEESAAQVMTSFSLLSYCLACKPPYDATYFDKDRLIYRKKVVEHWGNADEHGIEIPDA